MRGAADCPTAIPRADAIESLLAELDADVEAGRATADSQVEMLSEIALQFSAGTAREDGWSIVTALRPFRDAMSARTRLRFLYADGRVSRYHGPRRVAVESIQAGLRLSESMGIPDPVLHGRLLQQRANLHRALDLREAVELYAEALVFRLEHLPPGHPDIADNRLWLGYFAYIAGDVERALEQIALAERALLACGGPGHPDLGVVHELLANRHALEGRWQQARTHLERTTEIRAARPPHLGRSLLEPNLAEAYRAVVLLQLGDPVGAFEAAQRSLGRGMAALLRLSEWPRLAPQDYATYRDAKRRLHASESRLERLPDELVRRCELLVEFVTAKLAVRRLEHAFLEEFPLRYPSLSEIAGSLPENVLLLGAARAHFGSDVRYDAAYGRHLQYFWAVSGRHGLTWFPTFDKVGPERLFMPTSHWEMLQEAVGWPVRVGEDSELLRAIEEWSAPMLAGLEPLLDGVDTIWTVGELGGHLFRRKDGWLVDRVALQELHSTTLLTSSGWLRNSRSGARGSVLAVATGSGTQLEGDALSHGPDEVRAIAERFEHSRVLAGAEANKIELRNLAPEGRLDGFDIVHFAVHSAQGQIAGRSGLVLTTVGDEDGRLRLRELRNLWEIDADLVVAGGCNTFRMAELDRFGAYGLPSVLMQSGVRRVLSTHWAVDDLATRLLMDRFYAELLGDGGNAPVNAAEALRRAQAWLRNLERDGRRPFAHPVYWAGYCLSGFPEVDAPGRARSSSTTDASGSSSVSMAPSTSAARSVSPAAVNKR